MPGFNFHYFENDVHPSCQGSLTQEQFRRILDSILQRYTMVSPAQFLLDVCAGSCDEKEACLTFDCGLKSQYDVALPVLKEYGLQAFWLLYTGMLNGGVVRVEQYHHFRFVCFDQIDQFYQTFFGNLQALFPDDYAAWVSRFEASGYLLWSSYYTHEDRLYKYLRDRVLPPGQFDLVMLTMMEQKGYDVEQYRSRLWLNREQIRQLSDDGHIIGMHTHTHPNEIGALPYDQQLWEYQTNQSILRQITERPVLCMSHPCNSYNEDTIEVLKRLGVKLGFRADNQGLCRSALEVPRIDHATWIQKMKEQNLWP